MKKASLFIYATLVSFPALAAGDASGGVDSTAYYAIAAGIAIGLAAFGGALAQGNVGAKAMEGIARNPQARGDMFVPMILGLALIESIVIYALVISFQLVGKI